MTIRIKKTANSFSSSSSMRMYQQRMPLPKDADEESLKAEYKNKKLVISINKKQNIQKIVPNTNESTQIKIKKNIESNTTESNTTKENND